jgi:predicted porin
MASRAVVPVGGFGPTTCGGAATAQINPADNGAKTWNIGYEHRFSKRTSVGIGYAAIENDPAAVFTWTGLPPTQTGGGAGLPGLSVANTPLPGSDPSSFFVNILHRF